MCLVSFVVLSVVFVYLPFQHEYKTPFTPTCAIQTMNSYAMQVDEQFVKLLGMFVYCIVMCTVLSTFRGQTLITTHNIKGREIVYSKRISRFLFLFSSQIMFQVHKNNWGTWLRCNRSEKSNDVPTLKKHLSCFFFRPKKLYALFYIYDYSSQRKLARYFTSA